jgi:hypothetical protein
LAHCSIEKQTRAGCPYELFSSDADRRKNESRPTLASREPRFLGSRSVAVVLGLEGTFRRHADVLGLVLRELGELHTELVEVERGDLLIELFGKDMYADRILPWLGPERDLREELVGDGRLIF